MRAVLVLRALARALHDNPARHMGDAHRAVGLVDVLPAGALSSPYRLMRILRPIVTPKPLFVPTAQSLALERGSIGAQLVGYQQFRHKPLLLEKLAHQPQRRPAVAATLDQHVEDLAFVVDGTLEVLPLAAIRTTRRVARGSCIPALSQNRT